MKTILIREVPDEISDLLNEQAVKSRRSREKHALFIIEQSVRSQPTENGPALAADLWNQPVPKVEELEIDNFVAARGRRSNRP